MPALGNLLTALLGKVLDVYKVQRPTLLSDDGACLISHELKKHLETHRILHIRTKVYHPMTQGKIERYHRSMKNLILLDNYYAPEELTARIQEWVKYYHHHRYHETIDNVTSADKYYGRDRVVLERRKKIRKETMKTRRELNRSAILESLPDGISEIVMIAGIRILENQPASPKPPDDVQSVLDEWMLMDKML